MKRNTILWIVWISASLAGGGVLLAVIYVGDSRGFLLIGRTTGAHHQMELSCESCHTTGLEQNLFAKKKKLDLAMNKACLNCHKDELKVSNDSHPVKKFRDPRNADRLATLNALICSTCHAEHVPEVTRVGAVTLPMDYCSACHQKIGEERPSHKGLGYATCASAGCHNYHDNTALYEKFLARHAGAPAIADRPVLRFIAHSRAPVRVAAAQPAMPSKGLTGSDALAPAKYRTPEALRDWQGSGHARAGVNCAGCHVPGKGKSADMALLEAKWVERPGLAVCQSCHRPEARTFREGRHGMRFHPRLADPRDPAKAYGDNPILAFAATIFRDSPPAPMQVGESDLAMKPAAADREIGQCGACHKPHTVDLKAAAVEACAACHDDPHTRAYFTSPHFALWKAEMAGAGKPGTGVSCADCHMPKLERGEGFYTTHNQNAYLRPNEKMIRPVCLSCHGIAFAIDALADPKLVESNFSGRPSAHIESVDWAAKRARKTQ